MFFFPLLSEREKRRPLPSNRRGKVVDALEHDGERNEANRNVITQQGLFIAIMKRFLVEKDQEEDETSIHTTKKARIKRKYPSTFLTVNVNGLLSKINSSDKWKEKQALLSYLRSANAINI